MKILRFIASCLLVCFMVEPTLARPHHYHSHRYRMIISPGSDPISDFFSTLSTNESQPHVSEKYIPMKKLSRYRMASTGDYGSSGLANLIARRVSARIGPQWVGTALHIARIESGMNCNPSGNRKAHGVFQVIDPRRFGYSPSSARTCSGGVEAGIAHMQSCIARGAKTSHQLMVCHNSGSPFSRHVERAYRFALH